jgi:transposase-like protein
MAETKERRRPGPKYRPEVIRAVLYEVKFSSVPLKQIAAKYGLSCGSLISKWVRKYSSDYDQMSKTTKDSLPQQTKEKELEKALKEAQMKIICLETMIDIAEQELKIPIRKKSGAKQ